MTRVIICTILLLHQYSTLNGHHLLWNEYQSILNDTSTNEYVISYTIDSINIKKPYLIEKKKYSDKRLKSKLIYTSINNGEQTDYVYDSLGFLTFIKKGDESRHCLFEVRLNYANAKLISTVCSDENRLYEVFFAYDEKGVLVSEKAFTNGELLFTRFHTYSKSMNVEASYYERNRDTLFTSYIMNDSLIIKWHMFNKDTLYVVRRFLSQGKIYLFESEDFEKDAEEVSSISRISYPENSDTLRIEETTTTSIDWRKNKKNRKQFRTKKEVRVTKKEKNLFFLYLPPCSD